MTTSVDQRIVDMVFNNRQFESGIDSTLKSLDNLKKGLNLENAVKGLSDLGSLSKSISFTSLANSVTAIAERFSTLGIVGGTVIANLTNSVTNAAKNIFASLVTKPLKTGLSEYETQINAIQTVLANTASKGTNLQQVNAALDQLNAYSDKTIYNFTEMTKNIGTFTAAGISLETSVTAIKGIANLAAVSGSSSAQAATAMYQLSQALATGTVKLMDWNSVVNAGMGGQIFQDSLKETARALGKNVDYAISIAGSFRESLASGWLTSEVLLNTLAKFTGDLNEVQLKSMGYTEAQIVEIMKLGVIASEAATKVKTATQLVGTLEEALQSGWGQTWRIIIGDFEEARTLFTDISNILGGMIQADAEARNKLLKGWKDLGGRNVLVAGLRASFEGLMSVMKPLGEAFKELIPPITSQQLYLMTFRLAALAYRFKLSEENGEKLKIFFKGIASVVLLAAKGISLLAKSLGDLISKLLPTSDGLFDVLANIGNFLIGLKDTILAGKNFGEVMSNIGTYLQPTVQYLKDFYSNIVKTIQTSSFFADTFNKVSAVAGPIGEKIRVGFKNIIQSVEGFAALNTPKIYEFFTALKKELAPLGVLFTNVKTFVDEMIKQLLSIEPSFDKLKLRSSINFGGFIKGILDNLKSLDTGELGKIFGQFGAGVKEAFSKVNLGDLGTIFGAGLLTTLVVSIKKFVDKLTDSFGSFGDVAKDIPDLFDSLKTSLTAWQNELKAERIVKIAIAIGILALAVIALSFIDPGRLMTALGAIGILFAELFGTMGIFEKAVGSSGFNSMAKITIGLIGVSVSMLLLSYALQQIANLDGRDMVIGLTTIGGLIAQLSLVMLVMSKNSGGTIRGALSLVIFSAGILVLSEAVTKLQGLDYEKMKQGILGVALMIGLLAGFLVASEVNGKVIDNAISIVILAGALYLMSYAVERIGNIDEEVLKKGLMAAGAMLLGIGVFLRLAGDPAHVISMSIGVAVLAGSLFALAEAVKYLAVINPETFWNGFWKMAAVLGTIGVALQLMPKDTLIKAVGITVLAGALMILSGALTILGNFNAEQVRTSLLMLVTSISMLTISLFALKSVGIQGALALLLVSLAFNMFVPVLMILSTLSWTGLAIGLGALAGSLIILGVAAALMQPVIPALTALSLVLAGFGLAMFLAGLGVMNFAIGLGLLVALIAQIGPNAGQFAKNFSAAMNAFLDGAIAAIPRIILFLKILLISLAGLFVQLIPYFSESALALIISLIQTAVGAIPAIIQAGYDILLAFLQGIANNIGSIVLVVSDIIVNFINALSLKTPDMVMAGFNFILSFINAMALAADEYEALLIIAVVNLLQAMVVGLLEALLTLGLEVKAGATELFNGFVAAAKEALGIEGNGSPLFEVLAKSGITGFIAGVTMKIEAVKTKAREVVDKFIQAGKDKLQELKNFGDWLVTKIADSIRAAVWRAVQEAYKLAQAVLDAIRKILGLGGNGEENTNDGPTSIGTAFGENLSTGIATGVKNKENSVRKAIDGLSETSKLGLNEALSKLSDFINEDGNLSPVVRPVIDLTDIEKGLKDIGALFGTKSFALDGISANMTSAIADRTKETANKVGENKNNNGGTIINYTQNINSPTALTTYEIYRQTRNQLSSLRDMNKGGE